MYGRWLLAFGVLVPLSGAQATQDTEALYNRVCVVALALTRDPGFQGNAAAWFVHGLQY